MSNHPYQIRTTYLDGTITRDMLMKTSTPHETLMSYIMRNPQLTVGVAKIDIMDLSNHILDTHEFAEQEETRRAA